MMCVGKAVQFILLTLIFCGSHLLVGNRGTLASETIIEGQAGWVFFDVSGTYGAREAVLAGEEQEIGDAGDIHIQTGIEVDEGNGTDGDLVESLVLGPGEYNYNYVGVSNGVFESGVEPIIITVQGDESDGHVVIRCQHNFFAHIQLDPSQGTPHLEIHMGEPTRIACKLDGRTVGYSEAPFMITGYPYEKDAGTSYDGGTFAFYSEYAGDINVQLTAVGGSQPGSIYVETCRGDIRGDAWAFAISGNSFNLDSDSGGQIVCRASTEDPSGGKILGQFIASVGYDLATWKPIINTVGVCSLEAKTVTEIPFGETISFKPAPLPGIQKQDLVKFLPDRALSAGVTMGDIQVIGEGLQPGGTIEVKTGMRLEVEGTGIDGAVTTDRTLAAGNYEFEYIDSSDSDRPVILTVSGDTVIRCQYLFDAHIVAAEGLTQCPIVEVYAGPPVIPVDDTDPVPFCFGMHPLLTRDHAIDTDLTCGHYSSGGLFLFHTSAFGSIRGEYLDAGAGPLDLYLLLQDPSCLDSADPSGGKIILLSQRGDIDVQSLNVSGRGDFVPGNGGCVMVRGNNVSVTEGITADGAGSGSYGGQVYIEASDYSTGQEGQLYCSGSSETSAISARGGGLTYPGIDVFLPGAGGDVTLISSTLTPAQIDVSGGPVGTINEWFPDLTGILDYE